MKKNNYIDADEFAREMDAWAQSAERPEDRVPSERLGQILLDLHDGILRHRNFSGYRPDVKEEMKSFSLLKIIRTGLKSYRPGASPFAYFSRAVFNNYYTAIMRYYRRLDRRREYVAEVVREAEDAGYLPRGTSGRLHQAKKAVAGEENNENTPDGPGIITGGRYGTR